MHGKVLVIDPIATQRIVLRVKLAASQYEVIQASSLAEASRLIARTQPELILCALNLPDGRPEKLIARMRKLEIFGKVPVIALGSGADAARRQHLLEAGFDDVMSRPVDTMLLLARARSLLRSYASMTEWQLREGTSRALGFAEHQSQFGPAARVRIVTRTPHLHKDWKDKLREHLPAQLCICPPSEAIPTEADKVTPDAYVLISTPDRAHETLSLLAALRSRASTRHSAIFVVQDEAPSPLAAQILDTGASDLAPHGASFEELSIRLRTLLARKMMTDALRATVRTGIEASVIDPLTGLHNRRYAMPHVTRIAERAQRTGKPFALMIADMDHFKQINDVYGHAAGDAVLVEVAHRLRTNLRAVDLVARIGGEEFLIVMPGVSLEDAQHAAGRLCRCVGEPAIKIPGHDQPIRATVSIGMIVCDQRIGTPMTAETLLDQADQALYDAKAEGRNRVTLSKHAA